MPATVKQRMTADIQGDFVVFLIGMRINKLWKLHKWLPVAAAMPRMLAELRKKPESGFLGSEGYARWREPLVIQYWRSFEHLERYARDRDSTHYPAWVKFNKAIGSGGDVGIFHETYAVRAGAHESVYNNFPPHGLAKASTAVPAAGYRQTAAGRMGREEQGEAPAVADAPASN
jgi:hypothetical protein